ncbi:MAG: GNAT family N-acetyltransferase, partial [Planctomycetes bacterium]|nr:GNAT family N-acetyltransferase [Planctomycetota bacterium]
EKSWGKGYVTEAVRLLAWLSFEHLAAAALEAKCLAVNVGSQRVLEKCGFTRDTGYAPEVSAHAPYGAEPTPVCELRYELRRAEWTPTSGLPVEAEVLLEGSR